MKLRLWTPNGPPVFERDGTWCVSAMCITSIDGGDCDSGFWDTEARRVYPYYLDVVYELPLEVDE